MPTVNFVLYLIRIIPTAHLGHSAVVRVPTGEAGSGGVPAIIYRSEVAASAISAAAAASLLSQVTRWSSRGGRGGAGVNGGVYGQKAYVHRASVVAEGACGGASLR